MLFVRSLRRHAILVRLSIYALLASIRPTTVACLTCAVAILVVIRKILFFRPAHIIKHGTITAVLMMVAYLGVVTIVRSIVVWLPIRVSPVLSSYLVRRMRLGHVM